MINILECRDYDNTEFILLNYNSQDGMHEWVMSNFSQVIASGKLIYYRTTDPTCFNHSHSKNIAFKLATGDILCNINADHYIGKGFANYINETFNSMADVIMTTIDFHKTERDYHPAKDLFGKVCVSKNDFMRLNGFDESMTGYGFEDYDFINRVEMLGRKRSFINKHEFLRFITHGQEERFQLDSLARLYVAHESPSQSQFLYLKNDYTFEKGTLKDNYRSNSDNLLLAYKERPSPHFRYSLKESHMEEGHWEENGERVTLENDKNVKVVLSKVIVERPDKLMTVEGKTFFKVSNQVNVGRLLDFIYLFHNRTILEKNLRERRILANTDGYGKAIVYKNFHTIPISIN